MLNMSEYYKILHYLPSSKIDRHYPIELRETNKIINGTEKVYQTNHSSYEGIDKIQLVLNFKNNNVPLNQIKFWFSPLKGGEVNILELKPNETTVPYNQPVILTFNIDTNNSMTDTSKKLVGVKSIKLLFGQQVTGVEIIDLSFESRDYTYVLSDLDEAYEDGQAYVLHRLNDLDKENIGYYSIPKLLHKYVYMAAGAFAWLTRWEYEARPMKEPKSESNNYADRLLGQVETALQKYLKTIDNSPDDEYIDITLLNSTKIGGDCNKHHRRYIRHGW